MELWRRALQPSAEDDSADVAPRWTTPGRLLLELPVLRLWDFSTGDGATPALLIAPYALHDGRIADLAPGHSLVAALLREQPRRLYLAEWKSATAATRNLSVDDLLGAVNVAVDEIGAPVDLIGLCQGGWLSLVYAARFPGKVRRLVVAGAPIDVNAEPSALTALIEQTSDAQIQRLIDAGDGLVRGARMGPLWPHEGSWEKRLVESLEISPPFDVAEVRDAVAAFEEWDRHFLDLPGPFYRQVVTLLYRENRLARGNFPALGRLVDLHALRRPLYLLVGDRDAIAPPAQALAAARIVSGPVTIARAPCAHLALFIGRRTLATEWPRVAQWLSAKEAMT
jgi:poly(3-hydroxyalkanoate) synthetase